MTPRFRHPPTVNTSTHRRAHTICYSVNLLFRIGLTPSRERILYASGCHNANPAGGVFGDLGRKSERFADLTQH